MVGLDRIAAFSSAMKLVLQDMGFAEAFRRKAMTA